MKERPILFNGDMVRAILEGRKTQTRRVIKRDFGTHSIYEGITVDDRHQWYDSRGGIVHRRRCPYGKPGDLLWVRETHQFQDVYPHEWVLMKADNKVWLRTQRKLIDNSLGEPDKWRPSIHMPRWASRITLRVTGVRVERVQDISWHDAVREGIRHYPANRYHADMYSVSNIVRLGWDTPGCCDSPIGSFKWLWDSIYAKRGNGWDVNPWVWVVEFTSYKTLCQNQTPTT